MRASTRVCVCAIAAIGLIACGRTQEEKRAEEVQKAAGQVQQSAESMAKGLEEMAKGLGALAGGDPNAKPVEPVSFRDLQAVLPQLPGWERGTPTGERMTMPVNFAEASVRFTRGDAEIEQKIVDSALNQLLVTPFAIFLTAGYEKDTGHGYEKSVKVGDHPGWETWDSESKRGELNAVVAKRFIIQIEGSGIDSTKVLYSVMNATDLGKLAAMK